MNLYQYEALEFDRVTHFWHEKERAILNTEFDAEHM